MNDTLFAFPQGKSVGDISVSEGGLTLLDYFAAKAMQSYITRTDSDMIDNDDIANASYDIASAMVCAKQDLEDLQERLKTIDTAIKVDINDL